MRIRRIILNDFRAFPGPVDYEFKLDGQNLLLYGENGSGKSSLFVALREFFQASWQAKPFKDFRHAFTKDTAGNDLTTGKVAVEFDDGTGVHSWDITTNTRPRQVPQVAEASLRFGTVDYRDMLRTNVFHERGYPNLYNSLVEGILRRLPVLSGGTQTTLGALADRMANASVCEKEGVEIPFKHNPKEIKADKLWEGIVKRQQLRQSSNKPDFIDPTLMRDVETVRSTILNQLSHSGSPSLGTRDVRFALDTISRLEKHQFVKI